jgi:SpoVK/Ycf46/Vps4 family AAA+-type ATPase
MHIISRIIIISILVTLLLYMYRDFFKMDIGLSENTCNKSIKWNGETIKVNQYEQVIAYAGLIETCGNSDVIGHDHIISEIDSITNLWNFEPNIGSMNPVLCEPPLGVLLYGPPGTGKTTLSKQICTRLNERKKQSVAFLHVSSDIIENKYQGEGLKLMRAVFTLCSKLQPCVLFFDEIDGIMSKRSSMDQSHVNNMKTIVLSAMDQLRDSQSKVLVVAATNRPECIDPALMRRLELHLQMDLPTHEDKCNLLAKLVGAGDAMDYSELVDILFPTTFTLHDIQSFMRFCMRKQLSSHSTTSTKTKTKTLSWTTQYLQPLFNEYITTFKFVNS